MSKRSHVEEAPRDDVAVINLRKLLLADPDLTSREALRRQLLLQEGLSVAAAADLDEALALLAEGSFDLLLLDAALGAGGAWRRLVPHRPLPPILALTGRDPAAAAWTAEAGWVGGVIARPFRLSLLLGAIEAQLQPRGQDAAARIGPYEFRPADKLLLVRADGRAIRLTEKETAILEYLLAAGARPTARELLLDEVWGYNPDVTTHTLETHIYRLRQKIEPDPAKAEILVSEAGGYRLVR